MLRGTSKFSYESMGTVWEITIWNSEVPDNLKEEIIRMSDDFDNTYSRFKKDSLVTKISTRAGQYDVPEDFMKMLLLYMELYEPSDKKLNPLIGFTISDLGYDAEYSLTEKENVRLVPDLLETVKILDKDKIETKEEVLFDFGALGKGYFVDKISSLLKEAGFKHFLVNGSGDIYYFGEETATFGLEDPEDAAKVIGKLEITKEDRFRAFCASGTNRRKWPRLRKASDGQAGKTEWNHEVDAVTLESADFIMATWVQAESCAIADALATCLFFSPPENFLVGYKFEYCIMNKNHEVKSSKDWLFKLQLEL